MRWPWSKPAQLPIPPYVPLEVKPQPKEEPGIVVETIDMSATGIFKIFGRRPKE